MGASAAPHQAWQSRLCTVGVIEEAKMTKRKRHPPARMMIGEENGKVVFYIEFDGVRVAKHGYSDSTWSSLEPGFKVYSGPGGVSSGQIFIERNGVLVH